MPYKFFSLALLLFLSSTGASAQSTDSILNEQRINEVWQNSSLYISSYDGQCRTSSVLGKSWDIVLQGWVNSSLSSNKYDNTGRIVEDLFQTWDGSQSQWINSSLTTYAYSADGSSYILIARAWDIASQSWRNDIRITYRFNSSGYNVYFLFEVYADNNWQPNFRDTIEYNNDNRLTAVIGANWQNNAWVNSFKNTYEYSKYGLHTGITGYNWNIGGSLWQKVTRQVSNLLPVSRLQQSSVSQFHDYLTNTWVNSGLTVTKYYDNQTPRFTRIAFWDANTGKWINNTRFRNDYYADGSVYHFYYDSWDNVAGTWMDVFRTTYTHHGCMLKMSIAEIEEGGFSEAGKQQLSYRDRFKRDRNVVGNDGRDWSYTIQPHSGNHQQQGVAGYRITIKAAPTSNPVITSYTPSAKAALTGSNVFTVSPNPARGYFIITPDTQLHGAAATLKLFDLSGKVVLTKMLQTTGAQKVVLPVLAKGMYMVTVTSENGVQNAKLVVE